MTQLVSGLIIMLGSSLAASIVAKATLITALGLMGTWLARRSRAAVRHAVLAGSFAVLLALPVASILITPVRITVPVATQDWTAPSFFLDSVDTSRLAASGSPSAGVRSLATQWPTISPLPLLLVVWFAGTVFFLLRIVVGLRQVHSMRQAGLPWRHGQSVVERLVLDVGILRYVEVLLHESLPAPVTCGVFHPAIVLPPDAQNWDGQDLNRAIMHELEHVRRGDWVSHCLSRAVCAAYWFHPLVWMAWHQLALEAERSCDDAVLRRSEATAYADQLIELAQRLSTTGKSPALGMANRSDLSSRVRAVLDNRQQRGRAGTALVALACVASAVTVVTMSPLRMIAAPQSSLNPAPAGRQDITGTWQGSLKAANRESRVVFRISLDHSKLIAVMYSIDQGGQGTPASAITQDGSTFKMTFAAIGGNYEGKLTSDRKMIAGIWNQSVPLLLNLTRATPETAWAIPDAPPPPKPMQVDAAPEFEVATIKPSQYPGVGLKLSPGGLFEASGPTLSFLIKFAYDLQARQIAGGPSWLDTEKYEVTGKPDKPGKPSLPQLKAMIRKLLADRFQLTFHREKRELPVYAITIAKSGAKLIENDSDPNGVWGGEGISPRSLGYKNMTIAELANVLQQAGTIVDRPVVDQTGLGSTRYDFAMKWTPDVSPSPGEAGQRPADNIGATPDLFTAFQEQLGLKLESTKAPVDVLVIDRAEKPSAN